MMAGYPDSPSFLLECGSLPPYQQGIANATGKPVYSILDGVNVLIMGQGGPTPAIALLAD
nr:hypothetical protein [uncultured Cohaesibacter sp.]